MLDSEFTALAKRLGIEDRAPSWRKPPRTHRRTTLATKLRRRDSRPDN